MSNKDNAVALITGASSGIGLVTAKALQQSGYRKPSAFPASFPPESHGRQELAQV